MTQIFIEAQICNLFYRCCIILQLQRMQNELTINIPKLKSTCRWDVLLCEAVFYIKYKISKLRSIIEWLRIVSWEFDNWIDVSLTVIRIKVFKAFSSIKNNGLWCKTSLFIDTSSIFNINWRVYLLNEDWLAELK